MGGGGYWGGGYPDYYYGPRPYYYGDGPQYSYPPPQGVPLFFGRDSAAYGNYAGL